MGRSRLADRLGDPWLLVLLNLPALVVIVLAYIWAGLTETAAIAAVAVNKLPNAIVTVREGARALDPTLDEMARCSPCRAGALRHVVLPQLAPYLAAAARSGLSLVWKIVLVVELLGRPNGVGFEIGIAFQLFDVTRILAYALSFTAVVLAIETFLVQPLERRVVPLATPTCLTSHRAEGLSVGLGRDAPTCCATSPSRSAAARSARSSARPAAARPRCCGSSPGSTAISRRVALARAGALGMVFQEPRLLPWRTVEENVRLAAPQATDADARRAVRHARPRGPPRAFSRRAFARSRPARRAGARLRGRAAICSSSTSRSPRSTTRSRRACATSSPCWSTAVPSPRCW